MLHYLVSCYIPQTPTNSASYFRKLQLGSPRSLASAVALLLLGFRAALGGWLQGNRGPLNPVDELGTRLMYPPTSWIYDNFLLDDIKGCPPPNSTAHVQPGLTWGGWCLSWKQWTNGVESCKVVVLKSNCVESSLSWCTSHHFTYQNQSVMLKTHLPCAIGVRRFEFCGLINVFFSREIYSFSQGCSHEICSFPLGFSWNRSNEAYIPTFAHYIPTIFPLHPQKPIIFLPKRKDFQAAGRSDPSARMSPAPAAWHWRVVAVWTARWPTCTWPKAMPREAGPDLSEGIFLGRSTSGE